MIISASRRTDIPAFYGDWFRHRLEAGFALVRNPMNPRQVSRIALTPETVDCIVFWTRNPAGLFPHLEFIQGKGIPFYFQYTLTPYGADIESAVPPVEKRIAAFRELSLRVGAGKVVWRYDPILFTNQIDLPYHLQMFRALAEELAPHTRTCVISFLDFYRKTEKNMAPFAPVDPPDEQKLELAHELSRIALPLGITLESCAEAIDLSPAGIHPGKCIDPIRISRLCHARVTAAKDPSQRQECGCIESIDIGAYNTCPHGCLYCYANHNPAIAKELARQHNSFSPLLFGNLASDDKISERKMPCIIDRQNDLFYNT